VQKKRIEQKSQEIHRLKPKEKVKTAVPGKVKKKNSRSEHE